MWTFIVHNIKITLTLNARKYAIYAYNMQNTFIESFFVVIFKFKKKSINIVNNDKLLL